jgi:hypothetical protein
MNYLKNSVLLLVLAFLCSCNEQRQPAAKTSFPYTVKSDLDSSSCIIIYLINPIDCENCKTVDRAFLKKLFRSSRISKNNIAFVMPRKRPIEMPVLLQDVFGPNWENTSKNVFPNDTLVNEILEMNHLTDFSSYLMIYDPSGDSILYRSYIHEMDLERIEKDYL